MDRTRKLLMGVTASALLVAGHAKTDPTIAKTTSWKMDSANVEPDGIEAASRYFYQKGGDVDDSRRVSSAAAAITQMLSGVQEQNALAVFEILQRRPDLDRNTVERAIAGLMRWGQIRRTGAGSKDRPFRYYDKARSGSGG